MKSASKPNPKVTSSPLPLPTTPPSVPQTTLTVKALTWLRDSHGLFDYESFQLTKNTLKVENSCTIARCGTEVRVLSNLEALQPENPLSPDKVDKLATVQVHNGTWERKYYVESCSQKTIYDAQLDKLWLIVKSQQTQSLKRVPHEHNNGQEVVLRKGDVIKLGRVAFRIRDLRTEGIPESSEVYEGPYQDDHIDFQPTKLIPNAGNTEVCRICYSDSNAATNPLLSVCNCTGTLRFIHYKCLQAWLGTKLTMKKQGCVMSYYLKSLECEICKSSYPCMALVILSIIDTVTIGSEKYNLVDFEKPSKGSFIQLETFCKDKSFSRVVHIVQMDSSKTHFKLGRGHDSDLKIGDISVSRVHALIIMTPEGYVLQDNASKFGTLLLLPPGPHEIPTTNGLFLQVSRTTLGLTIKPNENAAPKPLAGLAVSESVRGSSGGSPSL